MLLDLKHWSVDSQNQFLAYKNYNCSKTDSILFFISIFNFSFTSVLAPANTLIKHFGIIVEQNWTRSSTDIPENILIIIVSIMSCIFQDS